MRGGRGLLKARLLAGTPVGSHRGGHVDPALPQDCAFGAPAAALGERPGGGGYLTFAVTSKPKENAASASPKAGPHLAASHASGCVILRPWRGLDRILGPSYWLRARRVLRAVNFQPLAPP